MGNGTVTAAIIGAIATILAALILMPQSPPPPSLPPSTPTPQPTPIVTFVSGRVFDKDTFQPLANVEILEALGTFRSLAKTGPDGYFEVDLSRLEKKSFPFCILITRDGWGGIQHSTDECIRYGETRKNINIYISDRLMRMLAEQVVKR